LLKSASYFICPLHHLLTAGTAGCPIKCLHTNSTPFSVTVYCHWY
jgi:hypothetical protein